MNSHALAQIFGPLFTCHYESENTHKSIEVFKFLLDMWPSGKRKPPLPGMLLALHRCCSLTHRHLIDRSRWDGERGGDREEVSVRSTVGSRKREGVECESQD